MSVQDSKRFWGTRETIEFQQLRIEALERELAKKTKQLKEAHEFMEKTAKEMEVEFEKL